MLNSKYIYICSIIFSFLKKLIILSYRIITYYIQYTLTKLHFIFILKYQSNKILYNCKYLKNVYALYTYDATAIELIS